MNERFDVAVIGGGPAGYTAALYAARAGLSTVVVEMLSAGGQMATTPEIENYPGFDAPVDGFELGEKMRAGAERFGAVTLYAQVTAVHLADAEKRLTTSEGDLFARAVILATGASPRKLGLPEEEALRGHGIAYCATCDGAAYRGRTVAVVGGGNSAASEALTLSRLCAKVYIVHRRDTLRAERAYTAPLSRAGNVEYVWNARVERVLHDDQVTGLALADTKTGAERTLACDGVFIAIGRNPETALFQGQVALDAQGYVLADESTRTSVAGVFAAGDLRVKPLRQIVTAAADGAVAAMAAEKYLAAL